MAAARCSARDRYLANFAVRACRLNGGGLLGFQREPRTPDGEGVTKAKLVLADSHTLDEAAIEAVEVAHQEAPALRLHYTMVAAGLFVHQDHVVIRCPADPH